MFRLSREIRFAVDSSTAAQPAFDGRNGHAGKPAITGIGQCFYAFVATLAGKLDADTGYLINIRIIDKAVREKAIPLVCKAAGPQAQTAPKRAAGVLVEVFQRLRDTFLPLMLDGLELRFSPHTSLATSAELLKDGHPMVLLHQSFEFAASHRLHNPAFSEAKNREVFGKCNNPHGHGHNYVLRVTLRGEAGGGDLLANTEALEQIVQDVVIEPFDHKHLNVEVPDFAKLNPSVENIAMVIYRRLKGPLNRGGAVLDSVTVWETPRTWAEFRE